MKALVLACVVLAVVGCSSPPKVVVPDGSDRKPVNSDARIADYRARTSEEKSALVERSALTRQVASLQAEIAGLKAYVVQLGVVVNNNTASVVAGAPPPLVRPEAQTDTGRINGANGVVTAGDGESLEVRSRAVVFRVTFAVGKVDFRPSPAFERELLRIAKVSERVEIRGRTDALKDNPKDRAIAQGRAQQARSFLLSNGIDGEKVHLSFLASGGHIADNARATGRALNRRVEIEAMGVDTHPLLDSVAAATGSLS